MQSNAFDDKQGGASAVSIFMNSVPGLVDNIRRDIGGPFFLVGLGSKSSQPFSLVHFGLQEWILRTLIGKFLPMQWVEHLVPKYGLVMKISQEGKLVETLQDPTGKKISMISEAQRHPLTGELWMGSHSNKHVAILAT
jgi:hypothetical protein